MKSILQDKKECWETRDINNLHVHHIYYGTANRKVSDKHGFWVWLRADWHNMSDYGVHFNPEFDLYLKRICQRAYEETHSREDFIRLIGRDYLDD